jgi:hypothetical protein
MKRGTTMKQESIARKLLVITLAVLSTLVFVRIASEARAAALPTAQPTAKGAPDPQQYPIMDAIANKLIQKYQNSTCEQLWQEKAEAKAKPKSAQEQQAITILHNDPQMRTAFINKIAAPIANKMFECGMIP